MKTKKGNWNKISFDLRQCEGQCLKKSKRSTNTWKDIMGNSEVEKAVEIIASMFSALMAVTAATATKFKCNILVLFSL